MLEGLFSRKGARLAIASSFALPALLLTQQTASTAEELESPVESQRVTIQFAGTVGDDSFACGETYRLGAADSPVTPLDFRLYVSEVALIDAAGEAVPLVLEQDGQWQHQNVALLDFEDKTGGCVNGTTDTRSQVVGAVPAGEYSGLRFTVGVPFALNHIDSTLAPSPLNLTSMWWNWNFGYKFVRLDFDAVADVASANLTGPQDTSAKREVDTASGETGDGTDNGETARSQAFSIHIGSVGCQMDSAQAPVRCAQPNQAEVVLTGFDPTQDVVVADLAALLADTNLSENQPDTAVGCMSSPEDSDCSGIMQNLGLPFQEEPAGEQTFFSIQ